MSKSDINVPLDRSWFYNEKDKYLALPEFKRFEEISGIKLQDITSTDPETVKAAQKKWGEQSVISNEIRKLHFGFAFPYFIYTHAFHDIEPVPRHKIELDKLIMGLDMCDSLRRRHIALSHGIIPYCLDKVHERTGKPLTVKNLGSGVGLDVIHAVKNANSSVGKVLNYDTNRDAVRIGRTIVDYMEIHERAISPGVIQYIDKSMTHSDEGADLIIMVGVICGLQDFAAQFLLTRAHDQLNDGGALIVSSSNQHMEKTDPFASFLIQHLGSKDGYDQGWSLNFRTEEKMERLLRETGFHHIEIFSDTEFPDKKELPEEILFGVDTLPAKARGYFHSGKPLNLPPKEILDRGIAYNWIAVATKV